MKLPDGCELLCKMQWRGSELGLPSECVNDGGGGGLISYTNISYLAALRDQITLSARMVVVGGLLKCTKHMLGILG